MREAARTVEAAQTAASEEKASLVAREQAVREKEARLAQELKAPDGGPAFALCSASEGCGRRQTRGLAMLPGLSTLITSRLLSTKHGNHYQVKWM